MLVQMAALAAVVSGLGARPADLVGAAGQDAYSGFLASAAVKTELIFNHAAGCTQFTVESAGGAALDQGQISRDAVPTPGRAGPAFLEHARVTGCGATVLTNLITYRTGDGSWQSIPMIPGQGLAGFRLQREVLSQMLTVVKTAPPPLACSDQELRSTLQIGEVTVTQGKSIHSPWKERWPVNVCGQARPVVVSYTPSAGQETEYSVGADW